MSATRTIAWRFLLKGTDQGRLSPMTLFAWAAIAIGVAAMSSLLAVMYGFESSLKDKVLKAYPHVIVRPGKGGEAVRQYEPWTEKLKQVDGVARVVPYLDSEMIAQSDRRALGAVVWGVPRADLESYRTGLIDGDLPNPKSALPQVVLGMELSHRLGADIGDKIKVISPLAKSGAMGALPRTETFEVSGLYASGHYEFDQQYLFLDILDAQDLLKVGDAVSGWHIWGKELSGADELQRDIAAILPEGWQAQSWTVFNSALFQSLKLEQYAMFSILSFAVLIAVMNVVITLMMHVTHKRKNIGILRALGASTAQIRRIFLWQGLLLGGVGLGLGALLTTVFLVYVKYFSTYQLPDIYYDRTIPIEVRPGALALIYGAAVVMIVVATLYPSRKAASLDPVRAIRE